MAIPYSTNKKTTSASTKVFVSILIGIAAGAVLAVMGFWKFAPLLSWDIAAVTYMLWVWTTVWPMDGSLTDRFAMREDPSRTAADGVVVGASLFSLAAVGLMLAQSSGSQGVGRILLVLLSVISVIISWLTVHTIFTLRYAELYYRGDVGGINFGKTKSPSYKDFAYVAFTLGMTFQTSDTDIETTEIRQTVLRHALLSYIFSTVIVASTINLVIRLSA